ncbi:pfEMP1 [Plasmodium falciparum HB3]|uniref:PfEMP1 n=1 Tax=Plasmodium falciparum (isolate HB3) TaxID=137071 RepID=A0A0L7KKL5_PLAFX|nr:pfEMP1 [Plasmodium falciparum HB3]
MNAGDSLKHYSEKLNLTYSDSRSQLCTELARSFADIGDIVRGRDLYLGGNKKEKNRRDDLEDKLKKIFGKIKGNNSKLKSLTDDQIREYWWELNRETVWKAITCEAGSGKYFRPTCGDSGSPHVTPSQCRCNDDQPKSGKDGDVSIVPTYFDYVLQYLRWFEEWAEDFCRKKKKKVENLEQQCRGKSEEGEPRYCDRNGFDCERTKYKKGYVCYR